MDLPDLPGFRIQRTLGRGGMATVYLAEQVSLHRQVALKVLAPALAADAAFVERFLREGRIAAQLRHRHIVAIHDIGVHAGSAYMALDYLPAGTLASRLPLAPREALRMLREIGSALDLAHRHGIVHRDLKPENILVDEDGRHVLSDFGIARASGGAPMTRAGSTVGTPPYMAPEQWRGEALDGRADLYSLGVVLYQALTGQLPFRDDDPWALGLKHMSVPPPPLPAPLAVLQPLLDRLLAKEPGARPANGGALVAQVEALERSPGLLALDDPEAATPRLGDTARPWRLDPQAAADLFATPPPAAPLAAPANRRRRLPYWLAAGLAMLFVALLLAWPRAQGGWRPGAGDSLATVAVLPCESSANLAEHRELGDTLAGELIHRLGRLRALTVIARSSSFPLRGAGLTARELGERLGASHLVACNIRRAPDGVRIGAELVDARSGAQRWAAEYERSGEDWLGTVDELALGISERLLEHLAGPERALLIRHRSHSAEAIRLVAQARATGMRFTVEALAQARSVLEEALRHDPGYASAHVAMAELDGLDAQMNQRSNDWFQAQAGPRIERALALDPEHAPAYAMRSGLACDRHDWQACRRDFQRALELEPGSAQAQLAAAGYHLTVGSRARAVEHASRAWRVDPESAHVWGYLTMALVRAGRIDEALDLTAQAVARFPQIWTLQRARALALELAGRCAEGVAAHERALAAADSDLEVESRAASLYVCAGQRARAAALLREFELRRAAGEAVSDQAFAVTHLALGNRAQALEAIEAMARARDLRLVAWITSPLYGVEQLAGDPRFVAVVESLHLPEGAMAWNWRG